MTTRDEAVAQMRGMGMPDFPSGHPRVDTDRIVRYGPKSRAWYRLHSLRTRDGRVVIVGAYGCWGSLDATKIEIDWQGMDPADRARIERETREREEREREKRARLAQFAANRARMQFDAASAGGTSEYLRRKGVQSAAGLRVDASGTLLVPMYRYDIDPPRLVGLQKIAGDGEKRFNKGMDKAGSAFRLGALPADGDVLLIAEGVATGLTVREAIDRTHAVVVAFDAGNLEPVARALRKRYPSSPLLICADDDWRTVCAGHQREGRTEPHGFDAARPSWCACLPGEHYARRTVAAVGDARYVLPRFGDIERAPKCTDFNDLQALFGTDPVSEQLSEALDLFVESGEGVPPAAPAAKGNAVPPPDDDGNGAIRIKAGELPYIVDQAEGALMRSDEGIYQRGSMLVRVVRRDSASVRYFKRVSPGTLSLRAVDKAYLVEAMTRASAWERWDARSEDWRAANCPDQVAATYLSRDGRWRLPRLLGAISAPTLRPDGSVLQVPGYDVDTAMIYDPCGVEYPQIPEYPTRDDGERALQVLRAAFKSFPFEEPVDESVVLAMVLTALVRRSLPSAPLGAITAPVMASGKSLIADLISILATGVVAPAMKYPDTDEEAQKTALAVLAAGEPVVLIDNIERPLQGDWLCSMVTNEEYTGRMLGQTQMLKVPTSTLWLATGNQLVVAGDLRTRSLLCRLNPRMERPETREFKTDIRQWMTTHRPRIVAAGLTVMRAFLARGAGFETPVWGRFERWSEMVRAPLVWLGCADPVASLQSLEQDDPQRMELLQVITAWKKCMRDREATVTDAISEAGYPGNEAFREALLTVAQDRGGSISSRRLGHWLRRYADRIVDAKKFTRCRDRDHVAVWRVDAVGQG